MCYQVMGERQPLVMIMGLTANIDWWDLPSLEDLSSRYKLLIFDNRGAGRTDAPPGEFSIKQFADDTVGLMDALDFGHAHVLGYSMGGMIAQELVLNYPEKVDKLVLCATFCGGKETVQASQEVLNKLINRPPTAEEQAKVSLTLLYSEEWLETHKEYSDDFLEAYMRAPATDENALRQFMACANLSTYDRLPTIDKPTLVACGAEDILIPPENSRIIARSIPGAKLVEYEGAGHGFMYQCREEFAPVLVDFLG